MHVQWSRCFRGRQRLLLREFICCDLFPAGLIRLTPRLCIGPAQLSIAFREISAIHSKSFRPKRSAIPLLEPGECHLLLDDVVGVGEFLLPLLIGVVQRRHAAFTSRNREEWRPRSSHTQASADQVITEPRILLVHVRELSREHPLLLGVVSVSAHGLIEHFDVFRQFLLFWDILT